MRAEKGLAVLVWGCVLTPWMVGCQEGMWGAKPKTLVPREQLGISQVPIPTGFEMDEAGSEDKSAGGWRYIRHIYKGKSDPQLVRAFYREQMPLSKWTLIDDEMRQGQYTLHFQNELETCEVVITRIKEKWVTKTKLTVEVSPRGRGKAVKPVRDKS